MFDPQGRRGQGAGAVSYTQDGTKDVERCGMLPEASPIPGDENRGTAPCYGLTSRCNLKHNAVDNGRDPRIDNGGTLMAYMAVEW
jgi:hypothetical protein